MMRYINLRFTLHYITDADTVTCLTSRSFSPRPHANEIEEHQASVAYVVVLKCSLCGQVNTTATAFRRETWLGTILTTYRRTE